MAKNRSVGEKSTCDSGELAALPCSSCGYASRQNNIKPSSNAFGQRFLPPAHVSGYILGYKLATKLHES